MPILLLFFLSAFSWAEELLVPIKVTARKDVSTFTFSDSNFIGPAELQTGVSLLSQKLENQTGLVATQNGGPGGRVSFFLRGTEARHISFTLDGLKLNDPSNTDRQFDASFLTTPFLKSVDVHKGPQAVLFGSDALGGLIELTTRKGENAPEVRANATVGSFGTLEQSLSKDWKSKTSNGTLTGLRFHTDGISRLNKKRFDATEKDSADITQLVSSSEHRWNSQLQTDILISFLRGENQLDGAIDDNSHDESQNDQYLAQQKTHLALSKAHAISLRNGLNRHQRRIDTQAVGEDRYAGQIYQHELLHRYHGSFDLLSGVSTEHEEFTKSPRSFDLHSAFVQSAIKQGDFGLQLGGRVESHSGYGPFQTGSGGIYYAKDHSRTMIQYSQGFKSPSLYQLYGPPIFGFPVGNKDLVPEVNHSVELSHKLTYEQWESGMAVFQNRLSNLITYTNSGYVNQRRFITEGIELSGKLKQQDFHLKGSFTHQNFRKEESAVLRRPENIASVGLAFFPTDTTEASISTRWFSARKDVDENKSTVKLNSFETIDLGFRKVYERFELGAELKNLLNREYEELYGYNVLPRSLFGHIGMSF